MDDYQKQRDYRDRQRHRGYVFLQKWVTPEEKAAINALLVALRLQQASQNKEAA